MTTPKYFIDTADLSLIYPLSERLAKVDALYRGFAGITTNPSAMNKIGVSTMEKFDTVVLQLLDFVSDAKPDGAGLVYVQMPNDNMSLPEFHAWCNHLRNLQTQFNKYPYNKHARIGLKIPPYHRYLMEVPTSAWDLSVNVTGIADASTIFRVLMNYHVQYASLIPGRMEEVGIDANAHMQNILTTNRSNNVITGSMRTLDGLRSAIRGGTVPTIGTRVFDLLDTNEKLVEFANMWDEPQLTPTNTAPIIDHRNIQLSKDFFIQMNEFGKPLYEDFIKL